MSAKTEVATDDTAEEKKGGKLKLIIIAVVVLAVVGGAGYWFFLKPAGKEPPPEPGLVVKLEPIQINLTADHYLKVGIALQATAAVGETPIDGSKALDATIALFSGQTMEELARPEHREKMKKRLEKQLEKAYEHEVMGVYFTDFVTQ
jgi:flagellar FliL protein